jgi:hypothetical protein
MAVASYPAKIICQNIGFQAKAVVATACIWGVLAAMF